MTSGFQICLGTCVTQSMGSRWFPNYRLPYEGGAIKPPISFQPAFTVHRGSALPRRVPVLTHRSNDEPRSSFIRRTLPFKFVFIFFATFIATRCHSLILFSLQFASDCNSQIPYAQSCLRRNLKHRTQRLRKRDLMWDSTICQWQLSNETLMKCPQLH